MRAIFLATVAIAWSFAAAAEVPPSPPSNVTTVVISPAIVGIDWSAPADGADAYRVYGVDASSAWTLLEETELTFAAVTSGFDSYAVTSVVDDVESAPEFAEGDCIYVGTDEPYVYYKTKCDDAMDDVGVYVRTDLV